MENVFIMSDAVYEELYDCYLSFNAIGELISAILPSGSDFPEGFDSLLRFQINGLEKVIQAIQLVPQKE